MASNILPNIASEDGLSSPLGTKIIPETIQTHCQLDHWNNLQWNMSQSTKYFHWRKRVPKCRVQNGGHFVSASCGKQKTDACSNMIISSNQGGSSLGGRRYRISHRLYARLLCAPFYYRYIIFVSVASLVLGSWWRHQMETFSALLAFCAGNSPVPGELAAQRPMTQSFHVFFDLRLSKCLSKQS